MLWSEGLRPLLADSGASISRFRLGVPYTAAMLGRQVLPLGAIGGPAVTAFTVDREVELGYEETLAVVTVAEFLSTLASLSMAAVGVAFLLGELAAVAQLRLLVYVAAAVATLLLALGVVFLTERPTVRRVVLAGARLRGTVGRVSRYASDALRPERTAGSLGRFYATVDRVGRDPRPIVAVFALHFAGWVLHALPLYTSALALEATVSLPLAFLLVATSGLVDVLSMPGGLGGVEMVLATLLATAAGMTLPLAAAVVMLYRLCTYWYLIGLGAAASAYPAADVLEAAR